MFVNTFITNIQISTKMAILQFHRWTKTGAIKDPNFNGTLDLAIKNNQFINFCMQVHKILKVTAASQGTPKVSKSKPEVKWLPKRRRLQQAGFKVVLLWMGIRSSRATIARIIVHGSGSQRNTVQVR